MSDSPAAEAAGQAGDRSVAVSTEEQRRAKLERLRAAGVDPYPHAFPDRDHVAEIEARHDPAELGEGEHEEFSYRVMGRIVGKRGHGKTAFLDVRDVSGQIQAYARRDVLGEEAFATSATWSAWSGRCT
jgi:lysyl-tRNA synthetase class 2